jgi:predicted nucleotidyltransferase
MAGQDEENALLNAVAQILSPIAGVAAIVLGGSRGRRRHRPDSDYDIGLYYRGAQPFDPAALDVATAELDDDRRSGLVTQFGGRGSTAAAG